MTEISATGVLQMLEARMVRSSKAFSGSVSRILYLCSVWTRAFSFDSMTTSPGKPGSKRKFIAFIGGGDRAETRCKNSGWVQSDSHFDRAEPVSAQAMAWR